MKGTTSDAGTSGTDLATSVGLLNAILRRQPVVLNYQMGEVRSAAVSRYLRDKGMAEWHIHRFYDTPVTGPGPKQRLSKAIDLALLWLMRRFASRIYLISGVRDPLGRDVAMFLQTARSIYGVDPASASLDELHRVFVHRFPLGAVDTWFDDELYRALGINVFVTPFDKDRGFIQLQRGRLRAFIYRLDRLNDLEGALAAFFEEKHYRLFGADQKNACIYQAFRSTYVDDLAQRYAPFSKLKFHFYADEDK